MQHYDVKRRKKLIVALLLVIIFTDIRLMCVHRQRRRQICGLMEKTKNRRKNKKLQ